VNGGAMKNTLTEQILAFIEERNWEQFHTPHNLVISIGAEVGELLECFQWKTEEEVRSMVANNVTEKVADEIADIYMYLVSLCNSMNIDLENATINKLVKNNLKYPVEKSFGSAKKYTEL
jgi:NTP pyrophosphatase (non-canonical NTP hydrolase)